MSFKRPKARVLFAVTGVMLLIALTATTWAIDPGTGDDFGIWRPSSVQDCPNGLTCMEWEWNDSPSTEPACCQDASMAGSTQYQACPTVYAHFRH